MAIQSLTTMSRLLRIGGLATGLDTDSIVKDIMSIERMKVDKLYQERQIAEWRKESYREVTNLLREFQSSFLDYTKPDTNMLSANAYKTFRANSSDTTYATAVATAEAKQGTSKITNIFSLATAASVSSSGSISKSLKGEQPVASVTELVGKSFVLTVDGVSRAITLDGNATDVKSLLQDSIDRVFGAGRISVTVDTDPSDMNKQYIQLNASNSVLTVSSGDALPLLGLTEGQSNRLSLSSSLEQLSLAQPITFNKDGNVIFKINGEEFIFNKNTSLQDVFATINASNAGVYISYSRTMDKITLQAKNTGYVNTVKLENVEGNFFATDDAGSSAIGIKEQEAHGTDASFELDGNIVITRDSNTINVDGVLITLHKEFPKVDAPSEINISVDLDIDKAYENIKGFIDKYNEMIEKIHAKLDEKRYTDYPPLTDEQKDAMKDDEIKKWEERAKSGMLNGEATIRNIVDSMRRVLYEEVKTLTDSAAGIGINLADIGIKTGQYTEKGKLYIDENKLKEALRSNIDQVTRLFIQKSNKDYSPDMTVAERNERTRESGLAYRLSDILNDYIRTTRDKNGNKGILLEKAGIAGDITEFKNSFDEEIKRLNKRIDDMNELLIKKEDRYWKQFSALETAIQRMNQQSLWLSQQFGSNS